MTEAANLKDETKKEPKVQAGFDGARGDGRGIRNWAGEKSPGGETGRYKRGQNVTCRVGLCEYEGGYSVTVLETGDFGILRTSTKLLPNDEIQAVFDCLSPVGIYNQHYTCLWRRSIASMWSCYRMRPLHTLPAGNSDDAK